MQDLKENFIRFTAHQSIRKLMQLLCRALWVICASLQIHCRAERADENETNQFKHPVLKLHLLLDCHLILAETF